MSSDAQPASSVVTVNEYHSQHGEDRLLKEVYFRGQDHGICIEVGAYDGVTFSNTLHFERLGWEVLLVEANPLAWERLRSNRRGHIATCAATESRCQLMLRAGLGSAMGEMVSTLGSGDSRLLGQYAQSVSEIQVDGIPLSEIALSNGVDIAKVDFVTIDVEGHELSVLKGMDLTRCRPRIIILEENDRWGVPYCTRYLRSHGYREFLRTGVNSWYAREDDATIPRSLRLRFDYILRNTVLSRDAIALLRSIKRYLGRSRR